MRARDYPYSIAVEVIFRDLDAMGHVNNAVFVTYLETARIKYIHYELGVNVGQPKLPMVVADLNCTFKAPAFLGEQLTVGVGVGRFGNMSFDLHYCVDTPERLLLRGKTVQVAYDYENSQAMPVPEAFKERVQEYQGDWKPPEG